MSDRSQYDPAYHEANDRWAFESAAVVVPLIQALVEPRSVIDVGCGNAAWAARFAKNDVADVWGVDGGEVVPERLRIPPERFIAHDLTTPLKLERRFDLVVALEVAEHLPEEAAETFVASLAGLGPVVAFSAAIPHQGGTGHVNEQWPDYWAALFGAHGYVAVDCLRRLVWHDDRVAWWYAQNLLLFAERSLVDAHPALRAERERGPDVPNALVHPRRFLEWVEWGTDIDRERWRDDPDRG